MRKRNWLIGSGLTMGLIIAMSVPVFASEPVVRSASASTFPRPFIGYTLSSGYNTNIRNKDDKSYNYVSNSSGFNLWVITKAGANGSNQTRNNHAIIPGGEWFITNSVRENGYTTCYLNISSAKSGTSGYLTGKWSPDSVGSYPVAN